MGSIRGYVVPVLGAALVGAALMAHARGTTGSPGNVDPGRGQRDDRRVTARFAGHGEWQSERMGNAAGRSWDVHAVKRDDGSLQAKLTVPGVAELHDVTVEAHVDGLDVFGVLLDEKGAKITSFEARLDPRGPGGTFAIGNGDAGSWDFDVATGRELRRMMGLAEVEVAETGSSER